MSKLAPLESLPPLADILAKGTKVYGLEPNREYLFVVQASQNVQSVCEALSGLHVRGMIVAADGDLDNFCRIYRLDQ